MAKTRQSRSGNDAVTVAVRVSKFTTPISLPFDSLASGASRFVALEASSPWQAKRKFRFWPRSQRSAIKHSPGRLVAHFRATLLRPLSSLSTWRAPLHSTAPRISEFTCIFFVPSSPPSVDDAGEVCCPRRLTFRAFTFPLFSPVHFQVRLPVQVTPLAAVSP